ncbi:FAD-binding and (Fe-S)-binding domain-containing protein [Thalassotalea agarivorans]|uniref:D-lactate dehydrogenase (cytochrome) n=1 Tax=Thalassotalea agarivorans TaxID=349064 RepID=A0A1I0CYL2_THASX|nr:FAD-binding and (Fe-S)-binding domain-containing protein [Thalassotalea agarivorans]SET24963.1 D-lactate dehydrogenase [Thalassotalea agarivorans]
MSESISPSITRFVQLLRPQFNADALITDYSRRFAYGTDASFYRMVPKLIVVVDDIAQMQFLLRCAYVCHVPVTFRAAGTSLSGQAITDSVLILLSDNWQDLSVSEEGNTVKLQPNIIGASANRALAPYAKKIGPDPASINSCKIGGIVANNASGMCCGVKHNSYHTVKDMTIVFADGSLLDTSNIESIGQFKHQHKALVASIEALAQQVKHDKALSQLISHKYRLKNTTGYGINALRDFSDGIDIIKHLLVGSEGTLGFIADVTYHTVDDPQHKATGLFVFNDIEAACAQIPKLAAFDVNAVELLDKRSLMAVKHHHIMPENIEALAEDGAALLIELSGDNAKQLKQVIGEVNALFDINKSALFETIAFTTDPQLYQQLWNIRKGTFPAVGANRASDTTVIIEDVSFPLADLAAGVKALHQLFDQFGYSEALIFGHALVGNLHFVFTQRFDSDAEIQRYDQFMHAVAQVVAKQFGGALKAEHGTGRNMAPFVAFEWGEQAYQLMKEIKQTFDPTDILNPGVIINSNANAHIEHLKLLPKAHDIIDKCIECGFCESVCPSRGYTLTPRQRITVWRQIVWLETQINLHDSQHPNFSQWQTELDALSKDYDFLAIDSCAATGLCGLECPVGINTGEFVKTMRSEVFAQKSASRFVSKQVANHFEGTSTIARFGLNTLGVAKSILPESAIAATQNALSSITGNIVPQYHSALPSGASRYAAIREANGENTVVYFPSCAGRIFGPDQGAQDQRSIQAAVISVLNKAGYSVIVPEQSAKHCCSMPWSSKGDKETADKVAADTSLMLLQASEHGKLPIITDASPCALQFEQSGAIEVIELSAFLSTHVVDKLEINTVEDSIALHITCSTKRQKNEQHLVNIARLCSSNVVIPNDIECCGFAGDKGLFQPALNANALKPLKAQIPEDCTLGISNSRTCEIGLSKHSGISYQSIIYLLDKVSLSKQQKAH